MMIIGTFLKFLFQNRHNFRAMQASVSDGQFRLTTSPTAKSGFSGLDGPQLVAALEQEIDEFWRKTPFHTVFLLYGLPVENSPLGGTCTDRAVFFFNHLREKYPESLNFRLHRALIKGNETHTVILLTIENQTYLIDIGANWPVMKLIPCFKAFSFTAFGIRFHSEPKGNRLRVFMQRTEDPAFQDFLTIDMTPQSAQYVNAQTRQRFDPENKLPFANGFRYAVVHGKSFYFVKQDNTLSKGLPFSVSTYTEAPLEMGE